ncbi:MAG TPA: glycerol-3-phosphate dehydrogenase C-terminal domain-containing protein, partial [Acidimicrobiales bacterium]|nr:glycerol-3-phosphate dehydrogenase C-terminal domain-containing protein [Acidimicrobiales bacterium]
GYDAEAVGATGGLAAHLGSRYGSESWRVHQLIAADQHLAEPLVEGLPYIRAEVVFAARHELARSVDDVLSRRTRARLLARDASARAAGEVGRLLADELGLGAHEVRAQVESYRAAVGRERAVLLGEAT